MNVFNILLLHLADSYLLLLFNQEQDWMEWNAPVDMRHSLGCEGINIGDRVKLLNISNLQNTTEYLLV